MVLLQTLSPQLHSPESQQQFEKYDATDGQLVFEESWPSTDRESSSASTTTSSYMEMPKQSERTGKSTVSSELGVQQDSVLSKYAFVSTIPSNTAVPVLQVILLKKLPFQVLRCKK